MISRDIIRSNSSAKRLGDVAEFLDARRRPVKEEERRPGPFPYYGANGQQGTIDGYLFDEPLVLLAEDGGHFDQPQRGVAYRVSGKTWVNNHAHVLRPKQCIDIGFLCRVLENYDLSPFITGTTRGKLTKAGAEEVLVPLPPLDEQRRIAAILDQSDDLRLKRQEALQKLEFLEEAIFVSLAASANGGWSKPLGDIIKVRSGGFLPQQNQVSTGKYPVFGGNGINGFHDEYIVEPSTIIIGRVGVYCGVVHIAKQRAWVTDNALIVDIKERSVMAVYLAAAMKHANLNQYAGRSAQPLISGGRIYPVGVPVPPTAVQQAFAARVAEIDKLKAHYRAHLAKLDALFASLQHRAFQGEL